MRIHEREAITSAATADFRELLSDWMRRYPNLTYIERSQIMLEPIQTELKFALRVERHGDDSKEAGLVHD